jgi:hypothetical protein
MPLIYGKTSVGFAEDLKLFSKKGSFFPNNQILIPMANKILSIFKKHPALKEITLFMQAMRAFAPLLFKCDKVNFIGPFHESRVEYNKEDSQTIRVYFSKNGKYHSQKITLIRKALDLSGNIIKSNIKTINAFVANYIHFLDATMCHYIIKNLLPEDNYYKLANFKLATIHDCFFIQPKNETVINDIYGQALICAYATHNSNLKHWIMDIAFAFADYDTASRITYSITNCEDPCDQVFNDDLMTRLESLGGQFKVREDKAK